MVNRTGRHCRFRLIRPSATRVYLVGDFNNWSTTAIEMTAGDDGAWQADLDLEPGTYRFRYHVDGRWVTDFAAFGIERNTDGDWDSICYVPDSEMPAITDPASLRSSPTRRALAHTEAPVPMFDH